MLSQKIVHVVDGCGGRAGAHSDMFVGENNGEGHIHVACATA